MSYVKNVWSDGDVITANKMNNIENGIAKLQTDMGNITAEPMISITWSELKAKRDGGNLTPGMQYRITDYVCTTTQEESRAVSHPYDIIVTADNANTLNESARACLHDGDNYYSAEGHSANLKAWELKYCLDNDTTRFGWADETNGKGVVYYLKDEHDNECPYDFKQIQFKRYKITKCEKVPSLVGSYTASMHSDVITGIDADNPIWCYTFSHFGENLEDATALYSQHNVFENKIAFEHIDYQMTLNNIVFCIGDSCYYNTFGNDCGNSTFGDSCYHNAFGNDCNDNTFGNNCADNTFGGDCYGNTFGGDCGSNTFGNNCSGNVLERNCNYIKGSNGENGATVHSCHVLSSTHRSSAQLYELPTKADSDKSVTYVGMKSDGGITTWTPADNNMAR